MTGCDRIEVLSHVLTDSVLLFQLMPTTCYLKCVYNNTIGDCPNSFSPFLRILLWFIVVHVFDPSNRIPLILMNGLGECRDIYFESILTP